MVEKLLLYLEKKHLSLVSGIVRTSWLLALSLKIKRFFGKVVYTDSPLLINLIFFTLGVLGTFTQDLLSILVVMLTQTTGIFFITLD